MQKLILKDQETNLKANWDLEQFDCRPVVKLFCPWGASTWLLTSINPEEPDIAFGLCDLGMGCPEMGYVSLSEIASVQGPGGLRIERDAHWTASYPLRAYWEAARAQGRIVWEDREVGPYAGAAA